MKRKVNGFWFLKILRIAQGTFENENCVLIKSFEFCVLLEFFG